MSTLEGLPQVIFGGVVIQSQERLKLTLSETLQPFTQEIDKLETTKVIWTSIVNINVILLVHVHFLQYYF